MPGLPGRRPRSTRPATRRPRRPPGRSSPTSGEPAFTQFSALQRRLDQPGPSPTWSSKRDPYDDWSGNSDHDWSVQLSAAAIRNAYPAIGRLLRIRVTKREGGGEWQGRVETLVLEGANGRRVLSGDDFRYRFGLQSTWFRL